MQKKILICISYTVYHTLSRVSKVRLIVWWGLASRLNVWWGFRFATKCVMGFRWGCGMHWNQRERRCHFIWGWYVGTKVYTRFRCTIFLILYWIICFIIVKICVFGFEVCISLLWADFLNCSLKFCFFILGRSIETAQRPTKYKLTNLCCFWPIWFEPFCQIWQ